ncbi:MAG: glycosyl transferase family protein [Sphingomonas fennica]
MLTAITYELLLFAAIGLAIGGVDDLAVDAIWLWRTAHRRLTVYRRHPRATVATLPPPMQPGRFAIFVPAWAEGAVIGPMLRAALARIDHRDYRIYVGTYPNDPATRAEVAAVAAADPRVREVCGTRAGPTTKAECLNRLWRRMAADEAAEARPFKAIVLHDAEDVVHPDALAVFDRLIERFDLVQLPVLPLIDRGARLVSGHYADEFVEAHGRQLVVREALGAGMPSAGVGCAIGRAALGRMAEAGGDAPFDERSLTEDYEIGLRLGAAGGRGILVRIAGRGGGIVATRAYFPATLDTAVRQKTRWLTGIALAGWDRLGWAGGWAELWMRLRDRRAILAAAVTAVAYAAGLLVIATALAGVAVPLDPVMAALLGFNAATFLWRIAMRATMVGRVYGWREGLWSIARLVPANIIAIASAWRAVRAYLTVREGPPAWDKTTHVFPADPPPCG